MQCGSPASSYGAVFQSETLGEEDRKSPHHFVPPLVYIKQRHEPQNGRQSFSARSAITVVERFVFLLIKNLTNSLLKWSAMVAHMFLQALKSNMKDFFTILQSHIQTILLLFRIFVNCNYLASFPKCIPSIPFNCMHL